MTVCYKYAELWPLVLETIHQGLNLSPRGLTLQTMKMYRYLSFLLLFSSCAMAQPGDHVQGEGVTESQARREQRRTELRQTLQSQRHSGESMPPAQGQGGRQLSPQERQALREQLRQQQQQDAGRPQP